MKNLRVRTRLIFSLIVKNMAGSGKKIRIKDIASMAGVSPGTVDRVIHNRGQVTEENRIKILKIINELDYKPNLVARSLANKKKLLFITLCPEFNSINDYWKAPDDGIEKAAHEIRDYNISVQKLFFDQFSVKSFNKQVKAILGMNPDGVLLSPVFRKETLDFVNELDKRSIPYIFIDSSIENVNNISYLGQHSFQSGYLAARMLNYSTPVNSSILIIKVGAPEISNQAMSREEGIRKFFQENGKGHKLLQYDLDEEKSDSLTNFAAFLRGENIKGIIVINSRAYVVADFIQKMNVSDINLIGYDLLPENIRFLKEGFISFLIAQRPEYQGYKGVLSLFDYTVLKIEIEKNNYLPIDILTRENIEYYLNYI